MNSNTHTFNRLKKYIDTLKTTQTLSKEQFTELIEHRSQELSDYLFQQAREVRHIHYGHDVYIRGLIEFTNYCKNDCYYCGIRCSNRSVSRYRLTKDSILECCDYGYGLGFRTFVLQGGEDPHFTEERMVDIISSIKTKFPECAITLSVGEKSYEEYLAYKKAGADRYLLRHETYDHEHYAKLHPDNLTASFRQECLWNLKKCGFQVGTGFMVGSPYQTTEQLVNDLLFIKELNPQMVGIGPFIKHKDTPFKDFESGSLDLTLFMLGLLRLMIPTLLLPATTALGSIKQGGRELGILAGANVVMPNLSPVENRKSYSLYDGKLCSGDETAEMLTQLKTTMEEIGYSIVSARGDSKNL